MVLILKTQIMVPDLVDSEVVALILIKYFRCLWEEEVVVICLAEEVIPVPEDKEVVQVDLIHSFPEVQVEVEVEVEMVIHLNLDEIIDRLY